jgi:hypothetical protein
MRVNDRVDYMMDENFDLIITNSDFLVGKSSMNHIAAIVACDKGHFRGNTDLGCGLFKETNGIYGQATRRNIIENLKKDSYNNLSIQFIDTEIKIKI